MHDVKWPKHLYLISRFAFFFFKFNFLVEFASLTSAAVLLSGLNFSETIFLCTRLPSVHWVKPGKVSSHMCTWSMFLTVLGGDNHLLEEDLCSDDDNEEGSASIYEVQPAASPKSQLTSSAMHRPFLHFSSWVHQRWLLCAFLCKGAYVS